MTKRIKPVQGGRWTPPALREVETMASQMKSQASIASHFNMPVKTFEAQIGSNKGDNPLRLAWERGRAKAEQDKIDKFESLFKTIDADSKMPVLTALIFFMKAQFGWRDKPEEQGKDAARITFVLPGSLSEADYYKSLGIKGPVDTRKALPAPAGGAPDMKDVTPGADGKLPTKVLPPDKV